MSVFRRLHELLRRMQTVAGVREFENVGDGLSGERRPAFREQIDLFVLVT